MKAAHGFAAVTIVAFASFLALSADEKPRGPGDGKRPQDGAIDDPRFLFKTDVPAHPLDVVLGCPTNKSIAASVLAYADREGVIAFGPRAGAPAAKTNVFPLKAGEPRRSSWPG